MRRRLRGAMGMAALGAVATAFAAARVDGASLDTQSQITLGLRTYSAARVGTEGTTNDILNKTPDEGVCNAQGTPPCQKFRDVTFPVSAAGAPAPEPILPRDGDEAPSRSADPRL